MSESLIHSLFSQSAQRLLLLEWLAERSRFDNDIEEANLFVQLQEMEISLKMLLYFGGK